MLGSSTQFEEFLNLFKQGSRLEYQKGEYIIRPGESPSHIFYIESGLVKAFKISKYGEENLLIIRKPHEIFPLIWAITGHGRHIIYQALTTATVWRINRDDFNAYLANNPSVLYPFVDLLIEQYQIHSERILNLEYRSVRERLASFLLTMAMRFGNKTSEGILIDVPLKQQDIASSINASRETTSRELSVLEKKGMLRNKQSYITLLDKKALQNLL
jgi:CRP/FNR family transcriptional regulator